jgi:hypothetical protein
MPEKFAALNELDRSVWIYRGTISPDTFIDIEFDPLG